MTHFHVARLAGVLFPLLFLLFTAAAPQHEAAPEELVRQANAAFLDGDRDEADRLYLVAEERTTDPGLVSYNRAAVQFQKGEFREAELNYTRVLDDADCPPERAARAWYNRGTCLLFRGNSASVYGTAIACLERCLDSKAADEPLKADARHNLELAKIFWNEARKKKSRPDTPNDIPPLDDPRDNTPPSPFTNTDPDNTMLEPSDGNHGQRAPKPTTQPNGATNPSGKPKDTDTTSPGSSAAPEMKDEQPLQSRSPEETRDLLRGIDDRLRKDRGDLRRALITPRQPGAKDW